MFKNLCYFSMWQLLLAVCERNTTIGTSCQGAMLPSITNVINLADSHDRAAFAMVTHVKQEPRERENSESKEEVTARKYWGKSNFCGGEFSSF